MINLRFAYFCTLASASIVSQTIHFLCLSMFSIYLKAAVLCVFQNAAPLCKIRIPNTSAKGVCALLYISALPIRQSIQMRYVSLRCSFLSFFSSSNIHKHRRRLQLFMRQHKTHQSLFFPRVFFIADRAYLKFTGTNVTLFFMAQFCLFCRNFVFFIQKSTSLYALLCNPIVSKRK